jgi:hypothetical protein
MLQSHLDEACRATSVFTAYNDVGVVAAYNFKDRKDCGILMSLKIGRVYDVTYKPKVCLNLEEMVGEEEEEKKKEERKKKRRKSVVVIFIVVIVGDVSLRYVWISGLLLYSG